ncbi:Transcriptional regulator sdnM [Colletotrichum sidae]|uniref:Transcriptional regulator sdnM n=1 Tax=Colletotrichum sidae TaxID=1347389 RepID=A0A4R8SMF1_9PEZI|nr:Transcriptional regulator sdnM [Colletotrichum sidae]
MLGFLLGQRQAPQRVPTDQVVPAGFFDDTIIFRTFVMYTLFVFDDVLDVEKLRDSLARVALGELEHHIPQSFTEDRPAIGFDHQDCSGVDAKDHPVASRIPHPPEDGKPAIVGNPDDLTDLYLGPNVPKCADDYLYSDRPELGLRVVSFKSSTIVVIHWIHLAFDAMAKHDLLNAWKLMLEGREDEMLRPLPPDNYVLENVGKTPTELHKLANIHLSIPGLVVWGLRNIYNLALTSKEIRMLCIPEEFLSKLRNQALEELATKTKDSGDEGTPFLSEGDVLLAWMTRLAIKVAIQQAYEWRRALKHTIPADRPFLGNCVGFLTALVPAKEIFEKPLSYLASQIRKAIIEQGTTEEVEAYASLVRMDPRNKAPPLFGETSMYLMMYTNWTRAGMFETDLSAAAVKPRNMPLRPTYVQNVQGPYNFNDGLTIAGKDSKGNYWISGYRAKGLWGMMEKELAERNEA